VFPEAPGKARGGEALGAGGGERERAASAAAAAETPRVRQMIARPRSAAAGCRGSATSPLEEDNLPPPMNIKVHSVPYLASG